MMKLVSSRVYHIDALRGWAIIMMLQGHFIDTLLQDADRAGWLYDLWKFNRGLTAPLFFTTSGVIVVYLMIRYSEKSYRMLRIRKAFWRGLEVLMWGYILRFNVWPFLFYGRVYREFWRVDVLHCIGAGLVLIALTYSVLSRFNDQIFRGFLLIAALLIFLMHPIYSALDYTMLPFGLQAYFTQEVGSVFVLFPFLGYLFFGGFLGSIYSVFYDRFKFGFIGGLYLLGLLLIYQSTASLHFLADFTGMEVFQRMAWNNFGLVKMGQVLMFYATFMLSEPLMARLKVLNRIGQKTLTVYIIHFVLLYGSWFGLGIDDILFDKRSLEAEVAIPGAIVFMVVVCWLTLRYHNWKDAGYPFRIW